jgi:hypothetical protein
LPKKESRLIFDDLGYVVTVIIARSNIITDRELEKGADDEHHPLEHRYEAC